MLNTKLLLLCAATVCALVATAIAVLGAAAPAAMAFKEFRVTGPITDKGLENVTINVGSYSAKCSEERSKGVPIKTLEMVTSLKDLVVYGGCSLPEIKFYLDISGDVEIENKLELKIGSCIVTVPGGQLFPRAVKYESGEPVTQVKAAIKFKGIKFEEKGGCSELRGENGYSDLQEFSGIELV